MRYKNSIKLDHISERNHHHHLFTTVLSKPKCYAPCAPFILPSLSIFMCFYSLELVYFFTFSFFFKIQFNLLFMDQSLPLSIFIFLLSPVYRLIFQQNSVCCLFLTCRLLLLMEEEERQRRSLSR